MKYLSIAVAATLTFAPLAPAADKKPQSAVEQGRSQAAASRARARVAAQPQRLARPAQRQRSLGRASRGAISSARTPTGRLPQRVRQGRGDRASQRRTDNVSIARTRTRNLAGRDADTAMRPQGRERSFTPPRARVRRPQVERETTPVRRTAHVVQPNPRAREDAGNAGSSARHRGRGGNRNGRERHRDWHERHEGDAEFAEKHRKFHRRQHHWRHGHRDRTWWRNNYSRFVLFGSGYYYWNNGYWYPAYGYDPYFSTYTYDAPIYGYNDLEPGQVIASVQEELQRRGYYRGEVDGEYGPMTRRALLAYQQDSGLPVTGEIDEGTLESLGFE